MKAATAARIHLTRGAKISIHAAREGGDSSAASDGTRKHEFQSTPPVKAATQARNRDEMVVGISIHAAREGGDGLRSVDLRGRDISIHAAREGGDSL